MFVCGYAANSESKSVNGKGMFLVVLVNVVAPGAKFCSSVLHKMFFFLSGHPKGGKLAEGNCKGQAREQMIKTKLKISLDQAA